MHSQGLIIYLESLCLHGGILLLERVELVSSEVPGVDAMLDQQVIGLRVWLAGHNLTRLASVWCHLLAIHLGSVQTGPFRRGGSVFHRRRRLWPVTIHFDIRLLSLHLLLDHLSLLVLLELCYLLRRPAG
jgi:hypothetical protein